ncbi:MAG: hypothetical protein D6681_21580 [Calditrichaeota bacterium]|nr:MAG: hypothetical protein D6681_21580 [Calditrichota bacterium]
MKSKHSGKKWFEKYVRQHASKITEVEGTIKSIGNYTIYNNYTNYASIELQEKDGNIRVLRNYRVHSTLTPYISPGQSGKFLVLEKQIAGVDIGGEKRVAGWLDLDEGEVGLGCLNIILIILVYLAFYEFVAFCLIATLIVGGSHSIGLDISYGTVGDSISTGLTLGVLVLGGYIGLRQGVRNIIGRSSATMEVALSRIGWGPEDCVVFLPNG